MKTWTTDIGRQGTAAGRPAADAVAAQYGLGAIVAESPLPARQAPVLRPLGAWNELTQAWDCGPTRAYGALAEALLALPDSCRPAARGRDGGPIRLTAAEHVALRRAQDDAA